MSTIENAAGAAEAPPPAAEGVADPGRRRLLIGPCCLAGGIIGVGVGVPAVGSTTLVQFESTASGRPWCW